MEIKEVEYINSFVKLSDCPTDGKPEFAFIGRSNVGKSSLINLLCGRKALALVSKQPGKTQCINYFNVDDFWYLVDLPGYGYAKVSQKKRQKWMKMLKNYLRLSPQLMCTFVLIDANVKPQKNDIHFINWLGENQIAFVIVYTKIDRLKAIQKKKNILAFQEALLEYWEEMPQEFETSSVLRLGATPILDFIDSVIPKK